MGRPEVSNGTEESSALVDAQASNQVRTNDGTRQIKARGREREVAEVGAIYPTQLFVNMLIIKTNSEIEKRLPS
jgi:hypothetical protein